MFGVPSADVLEQCRRLGIKTVGAATTLDEAIFLENAGVDMIIASGFEAGGHRPSFLKSAEASTTGTFVLLQLIKEKVKAPIIAAGGIANGKGVAAALALGASAAQIGTAFWRLMNLTPCLSTGKCCFLMLQSIPLYPAPLPAGWAGVSPAG